RFRLALIAAPPDRSDRVDHPFRRQFTCRRGDRLAGRESVGVAGPTDLAARLQDRWAAAAVDRAVHAAPAEEAGVRRVDDRVDLLLRDVALDQAERSVADLRGVHGAPPVQVGDLGPSVTAAPSVSSVRTRFRKAASSWMRKAASSPVSSVWTASSPSRSSVATIAASASATVRR